MSKKTKRLEKENLNLTRKQEATNKNIFQMAEERSQSQQTIDRLARENEKLKKLCRAMQSGGYGMAGGMAGNDPNAEFDEGLEGETESEYEDEEYDEDEEGEYEEDTEEEGLDVQQQHAQQQQLQQQQHQQAKMFGPAPPPPPPVAQQQALPNGKAPSPQQPNGSVNGTRH